MVRCPATEAPRRWAAGDRRVSRIFLIVVFAAVLFPQPGFAGGGQGFLRGRLQSLLRPLQPALSFEQMTAVQSGGPVQINLNKPTVIDLSPKQPETTPPVTTVPDWPLPPMPTFDQPTGNRLPTTTTPPPTTTVPSLCPPEAQQGCAGAALCFQHGICEECAKIGTCRGGCTGCNTAITPCAPCFAAGGPLHGMAEMGRCDGDVADGEGGYCESQCFPFLHCVHPNSNDPDCEHTPKDCMQRCAGCPEVRAAMTGATLAPQTTVRPRTNESIVARQRKYFPKPDSVVWDPSRSLPLGPHARTAKEFETVAKAKEAKAHAQNVLDYYKELDKRLQNATAMHALHMTPASQRPKYFNETRYNEHKRPFQMEWAAPPIAQDLTNQMKQELQVAIGNTAKSVPEMVHNAIMSNVERQIKALVAAATWTPTQFPYTTVAPTTPAPIYLWPKTPAPAPPPTTTPLPEPPAAAPAAAPPIAAPVAAPAAAPMGGPAAGPSSIMTPLGPMATTSAMEGMFMGTTTASPTTPVFTTTPGSMNPMGGPGAVGPIVGPGGASAVGGTPPPPPANGAAAVAAGAGATAGPGGPGANAAAGANTAAPGR